MLYSGGLSAETGKVGQFIFDGKTGCKVWNPHPQPNESVNWSGSCLNGFAHGRGVLLWLQNGKPYEKDEGEWKEGYQSGIGTQDWQSGRYEGELLNGEPNGRGTLSVKDVYFKGEFLRGKPNGFGTVKNADGIFKGTWHDGCVTGLEKKIAVGVPLSACP